jgi:hypothetical protein
MQAATAIEQQQQQQQHNSRGQVPPCYLQDLDSACLQLCLALLDHSLRGSVYNSVVIGFLAVLGIRIRDVKGEECVTFCKAALYTPKLSAFIKMA